MERLRGKETILNLLKGNHRTGRAILGTVSGAASTKTALVELFDREIPAIGLITTKSFQMVANPGNREPIITEPVPGSYGNSVGLRNPGLAKAHEELTALRERRGSAFRAILNVSVSASSPEDFISLIQGFGDVADIIELNFSCPHASAGYGASIGCDLSIAAAYMRQIRQTVGPDFPALLFPKLTPNVQDIGSIAAACIEAGADGISAVNTFGPDRFLEPHSGKPILNNHLDGRGGRSGSWIRTESLVAVRTIRKQVGPDIPVIGMGGVATASNAREMMLAGADVVGIGSAFSRVHPREWKDYTDAVLTGMRSSTRSEIMGRGGDWEADVSEGFLEPSSRMTYTPFTVTEVITHSADISVIRFDGRLDCGPGQFAFLWLPGVGEKPFSVAETDPLTFVVKRRGIFTENLLKVVPGDIVYARGVYGEALTPPATRRARILAGGTGIAVIPSLVDRLRDQDAEITIFYGTSGDEAVPPLYDRLSQDARIVIIPDAGVPGRVIQHLQDQAIRDVQDPEGGKDTTYYMVGPERFMAIAAASCVDAGMGPDRIHVSMERPTLCGIGMCGECVCGDRLMCRYGTFISYTYLLGTIWKDGWYDQD